MTKERNAQLDIAKGLGMAIVVLFHARILSGVWTQFHMPLFAFLSGILYREQYNTSLNQVCVYTKKKIKGCYVPFVIYNFVFLMLHNLFYKIHIYGELGGKKYYNIKDFLHQIIAILTMGGGESLPEPMWYLIAMLEFTILYTCIRFCVKKYLGNKNKTDIYVTTICACLMMIGFSAIALPRMLNKALILMFYYHLGYMAYLYLSDRKENRNHKRDAVIIVVFSISVLISGMWKGGDWPTFSGLIIPAGCAGIILTLNAAQILDKYTRRTKEYFIFIGQHTLFILGTQYLGFKAGNMLQILFQKKAVNWLEMYGVSVNEPLKWKIIYFLCGLLIPLIIVKGKDALTVYLKKRKDNDKKQANDI